MISIFTTLFDMLKPNDISCSVCSHSAWKQTIKINYTLSIYKLSKWTKIVVQLGRLTQGYLLTTLWRPQRDSYIYLPAVMCVRNPMSDLSLANRISSNRFSENCGYPGNCVLPNYSNIQRGFGLSLLHSCMRVCICI